MIGAKDFAVVGAGVAGLAIAIRLREAGHRVVVHERFDTPRPLGSGLLLQPTGLAAMQRLGLAEAIAALGQKITRLHGRTASGTEIFDVDYGNLAPGLHALAVHRAALHGVLWEGFVHSGAELQTGSEITASHPAAGGGACPVAANGQIHPRYDLVIDASGARSMLRAALAPRPARPFAYGAVWASVPDVGLAPATLAQRYVGAHIMLGYLPVGRIVPDGPRLAGLFWSLRTDGVADWRAQFAAWQGQVAQLWPELGPVVADLPGPEEFSPAFYSHFTARHPAGDGVVLIGDAAHATSPQLGQGANQGLIDAVVLADALAAGPDIATALQSYARLRRAHVRFYQHASVAMTPFFQSDWRLAGWARDRGFRHLKRVPWLHREMLRTLAGLKTGLFSHRPATGIVNAANAKTES